MSGDHIRDEVIGRVHGLSQELEEAPVCHRCSKQKWGVHTCSPTKEWREMEAENKELKAKLEVARDALEVVHAQLIDGKIFTQQMHMRPYWRYSVNEALAAIKEEV